MCRHLREVFSATKAAANRPCKTAVVTSLVLCLVCNCHVISLLLAANCRGVQRGRHSRPAFGRFAEINTFTSRCGHPRKTMGHPTCCNHCMPHGTGNSVHHPPTRTHPALPHSQPAPAVKRVCVQLTGQSCGQLVRGRGSATAVPTRPGGGLPVIQLMGLRRLGGSATALGAPPPPGEDAFPSAAVAAWGGRRPPLGGLRRRLGGSAASWGAPPPPGGLRPGGSAASWGAPPPPFCSIRRLLYHQRVAVALQVAQEPAHGPDAPACLLARQERR